MTQDLYDKICESMRDLDEDTLLECIQEVIEEGTDAAKAMEACQKGIAGVGELFQSGEYFVGDLIYSGDLMNEVVDQLKPLIAQGEGGNYGKMILCTVKNDIHDIGKNIVKSMLECNGMEVVDLGVDVDADTIVAAAKEQSIHIIALSCVLTLGIDSMKNVVDAFVNAGLRNDVKIIIGGAPVTEAYCEFVGADDWAIDVSKTVKKCVGWAKEYNA